MPEPFPPDPPLPSPPPEPHGGDPRRAEQLLVVGASYRTAPPRLRDVLTTDDSEMPLVLDRLRRAGLTQALWLATCDRIEVQAVTTDPKRAAAAVLHVFAERCGGPVDLTGQTYTLVGRDAARHLFGVACSLDSQVLGEPHVLGQIKAAHRQAAAAGLTGSALEAALQAAYAAAKRVRSETALAERPTSLAAAAVQVARDIHGDLNRCTAAVIGLGDMAALLVEQFREAGLARVLVSAEPDRRAESLARRLNGHWAPYAELDATLAAADIVMTAAGLGRYILDRPRIAATLRRRRRRPMFLVDTAIPADIDPAVSALDGAFVYDLADLERLAVAGRASREAAAAEAWTIVDQAVADYGRVRAERAAVPAVAALRRHFESTRLHLLAEHPGLDGAAATRLLINRLLHQPSEALRELAAKGDAAADCDAAERLLRRLFRLDDRHSGEENS